MNSRFLLSLGLAVVTWTSAAWADDVTAAKARLRERVPTIDKLKRAEIVGESNRGLLHVRQSEGNADQVASAENADRQIVFADTAARTGSSVETVGRAFAKQMAAASAPGVWLQRENGEWYRK